MKTITVNEDGSPATEKIDVIVGDANYEIVKTDVVRPNYHTALSNLIDRIHQVEKTAMRQGQTNTALNCIALEARLYGLTSARAELWMTNKMVNDSAHTPNSPRLPEHDSDERFAPKVVGMHHPLYEPIHIDQTHEEVNAHGQAEDFDDEEDDE